ncbi:hypothetical protein MKW98_015970 [Papaver atlanticum]|uniref:Manganese-transporting ATPase PDR2 n=1 Tax=Papaver atlanticum TaxID=357466 RepID=A0AAD4RVF2_9MAGN|nr:hypothetical protein MKW98_015970 [Papaver atlanticum]
MPRFTVNGKVVEGVDLLKKRSFPWRLDVFPFAFIYSVWAAVVVPSLDFFDGLIVLGGLGILHILVLLFEAWSVDFRCIVEFNKVKDIHQADSCKIIPAKFSGSKEIVPLRFRKPLVGSSSAVVDGEEIYFDFRKQRFIYSKDIDTFSKLRYPSKEAIGYYLKCTGHGTDAKVAIATDKWGRNVFEYPQPTFQKLMKEHCMEPFFVFQVFCVGLWCMDDYWYYSLFTLFMLFLFESTMAKARLKTLTELRTVRVDSQTLMVYRCGKWIKLSGTDLLPGDVVSVGRSSGQNGEDKCVPADMLILAGNAIVNEAILTGESTPQWKVSVTGRGVDEKLSSKRDKSHILFGGTKILQHNADKSFHLKTPDGGCLAVVLRTGFETNQGKLMRTILFSTERVTANSWESGLFILFLVVFALIAAGYVLKKGLEDPTRSRYKLFLSCTLIITSVIPPELPMELSIAVNTSLIALARHGIFCTEPFRIPFAGKVDICCFDKTGTLTSDDMEFQGVVGLDDSEDLVSDMTKVPLRTVEILAACHALVFVDNKLVGDPLEKAALKGIDWTYTSDEKAMSKKGGGNRSVQIVQRHHFASHLKRMAVVTRIQDDFFAFVKGAPETIQDRLIDLPSTYVETYKKYTRQGSRVLALAFKPLGDMAVSEARNLERDSVENGLTFVGFVVFNCPIRADSASVLSELKASSHDLVMITGDQALTACHVASQVHIISKPSLILSPARNSSGFEWISPDETNFFPFSKKEVEALSESYDLCIGGDSFEMLQQTSAALLVIPYVKVFARVAPEQKELILTTFKTVGRMTLMCGDGTNDVGALKQAHVGVALLNAIPPAKVGESSKSETKSKSKKPKAGSEPSSSGVKPSSNIDSPAKNSTSLDFKETSGRNQHLTAADRQREKLKKLMEEMNDEGDGRAPPIVKLGDASMASPFTAKHASVAPTTDIIRQGRSTLVTTLQMFKILGLNCLATAYVLSVMYLDGVKLGDVQATISGMFTAAFFLFISHARPLPTLSAARPHPNIFCAYVFLSLLGQFAMHILFLISSVNEAQKYMPEECIEPDSEFHPNLVNTVSYMVNMMIQVATFAVNYMGHPFNQSISENKPFKYALAAAVGFFVVITSDMFRDLNDSLKLVPMPAGLRDKLLIWALFMFLSCYTWERFLRWVFPGRIPSWKKRQQQAAATLEKKHV